MLKNSLRKIVLWITLGLVFTAGAVLLLVLAVEAWPGDGAEGGSSGSAPSTSWYTTAPQGTSDGGGTDGGGGTMEPSAPSEPSTPTPVVTQTIISVPQNDGGSGGDGPVTLIAACGSLLSGAAAIGTLLHAVHLSRQNRGAAARGDDATSASSS